MLDEPTIGLDPHGARALRSLIKEELCEKEGVTVLYTTHYMQEADDMSDRVAIIHHGAKVAEGTPSEMRAAAGDNRVVEMEVSADGGSGITALDKHPMVERVLSVREEANTSHVRLRTREPLRSVGQLSLEERLPDVDVHAVNLVQPTLEGRIHRFDGLVHIQYRPTRSDLAVLMEVVTTAKYGLISDRRSYGWILTTTIGPFFLMAPFVLMAERPRRPRRQVQPAVLRGDRLLQLPWVVDHPSHRVEHHEHCVLERVSESAQSEDRGNS